MGGQVAAGPPRAQGRRGGTHLVEQITQGGAFCRCPEPVVHQISLPLPTGSPRLRATATASAEDSWGRPATTMKAPAAATARSTPTSGTWPRSGATTGTIAPRTTAKPAATAHGRE